LSLYTVRLAFVIVFYPKGERGAGPFRLLFWQIVIL
jgi:hypothetical protein